MRAPNRRREAATDMEEPTGLDLAEVEAEWPLIAAEIALVDAEVAALTAGTAVPELARRRVRRAEARVAVEARAWASRQRRMQREVAA